MDIEEQIARILFQSFNRVSPIKGYDKDNREISHTERLLAAYDIPTHLAPTITVTGSKGKGSTATFAAAILQGTGHKVGLVTSPGFAHWGDRIRVNGEAISGENFLRILQTFTPFIDAFEQEASPHSYLSPTGLILAAALRYFEEQGVTAMVLEVGRGGRFDDVSVAYNDVACITPIMEEHLDKLGPTIDDVVWHKAGILQPNTHMVSARQDDQITAALKKTSQQQNADFWQVGEDILFEYKTRLSDELQVDITMPMRDLQQCFKVHNYANYQAMNLALAYGSVAALMELPSQSAEVETWVKRLKLPGRVQQINEHPQVFVDGAINRETAEAYRQSVQPVATTPIILVAALPHDKDHEGFLEELMPHVDHTIITHATGGYLTYSPDVLTTAHRLSPAISDQPDFHAAIAEALERAGSEGTIWCVGTQSFVRDCLIYWEQSTTTLFPPSDHTLR